MKIKLLLTTLLSLLLLGAAVAQNSSQVLVLEQSSFKPVQTDALTGVNIDPIAKDSSRRPCARIKLHVNRMTKADIDDLEVRLHSNNELMRCKTADYDNGLIIEMTAKPQTRFYIHHSKFGDSEEVTVDLEPNKEYLMEAFLNVLYPITILSNIVDADVYIDNAFVGRTNSEFMLTVQDVVPGEHTLKVVCGGVAKERKINVHAGAVVFRQEVSIQATMPQYVVFRVKPANAIVEVDGALLSVSSADGEYAVLSKTFRQGSHQFTVSAPDYHTKSGTIVVRDTKVMQTIDLDPAFGYLNITGDNIAGAAAYIDDHMIGVLPLEGVQLASKAHTLKIVKARYKPYATSVTITDNTVTPLNVHLEENFAKVQFNADEGVHIWVNGEHVGTGRANTELEVGDYTVEGRKEGYEKSTTVINITSSATKIVNVKSPQPIYGSINIESTPMLATVMIDGKEVGETPMAIPELIVGKHNVVITKQGYKPYTQEVEIVKGGKAQINAMLMKVLESKSTLTSSSQLKSATPKTTVPKATAPKVTTPKATTPVVSTPVATTPKTTTPTAPKATPQPKTTTPKPKADVKVDTSTRFESSIDVGYSLHAGDDMISHVGAAYIGGLRAGKTLFVGLGVGAEYNIHKIDNQIQMQNNRVMAPGAIFIPAFAHLRIYMGRKANNFVALSAGAKLLGKGSFEHKGSTYSYHTNGLFGDIDYGILFGKFYISAGFTMQSYPYAASYTDQQLELKSMIMGGGKLSIGFTF